MEMVTAMPENANAWLIMSMPKIVQFLDVSSYSRRWFSQIIVKLKNHYFELKKICWLLITFPIMKKIEIFYLKNWKNKISWLYDNWPKSSSMVFVLIPYCFINLSLAHMSRKSKLLSAMMYFQNMGFV